MGKMVNLKVGSKTDVNSLKTSIVGNIKAGETVIINAIGAGANYIAVKAIIMARGQLNSCGCSLFADPSFHDYEIESPVTSSIKTGIRWILKLNKALL